jgi:hypothetical protein
MSEVTHAIVAVPPNFKFEQDDCDTTLIKYFGDDALRILNGALKIFIDEKTIGEESVKSILKLKPRLITKQGYAPDWEHDELCAHIIKEEIIYTLSQCKYCIYTSQHGDGSEGFVANFYNKVIELAKGFQSDSELTEIEEKNNL